jgi:hypothetical protein
MGTLTLTAPELHEGLTAAPFTAQLGMGLVLLGLLFASLLSSAMALRYYNHAGFIVGMPMESEVRRHWSAVGTTYLRRAGLYTAGACAT